ncbi:hypothetical protein BV898_08922 [Hypsibius exemplaris]|uniref:Uncharacterized protein n=1 Tax=Hypsibius exemplaris TaxID=2072580 RepID=A0A1W0WNW4_HYPEX|nr:hypothetical protein BV898_08922 [Hypsibius exemplaris]
MWTQSQYRTYKRATVTELRVGATRKPKPTGKPVKSKGRRTGTVVKPKPMGVSALQRAVDLKKALLNQHMSVNTMDAVLRTVIEANPYQH